MADAKLLLRPTRGKSNPARHPKVAHQPVPDRPWGNRSGLAAPPPRTRQDQVPAALRDEPELIRTTLVEQLIYQSRQEWRGTESEILEAAYDDPRKYWAIQLEQPRTLNGFANLLGRHLIDPNEKSRPLGGRFAVPTHVLKGLDLARKVGADFFFRNEHGLFLRPLEAVVWFPHSPTYREFIPPGLRAYVEGRSTTATPSVPPGKRRRQGGRPSVVQDSVTDFWKDLSAQQRGELSDHALAASYKADSSRPGDERYVRSIIKKLRSGDLPST